VTATAKRKTARARRDDGAYDARRNELAESALRTLGELGYARTSLRDIAANSELSHGVVHYYFRDKTELITYCVRYYKARCVHRYDGVVDGAKSADQLLADFADKLCETITLEAPMHRLWYDLRTQSMFDEDLRPDVLAIDNALEAMIWRVLTRFAALSERPLGIASPTAYAMLDGVFERALLRWLSGDADALPTLRETVITTLPRVLG
jgi:TetR/AcrR family transcriptional regulator, transcriptional repressor of bet genes